MRTSVNSGDACSFSPVRGILRRKKVIIHVVPWSLPLPLPVFTSSCRQPRYLFLPVVIADETNPTRVLLYYQIRSTTPHSCPAAVLLPK